MGRRVVFLIQPQQCPTTDQQQWSDIVQNSVLKLLHYFGKSCSRNPSSQAQALDQSLLKWGYKFLNAGTTQTKTYRSKQEWKQFGEEEFLFFREEVKYVAEEDTKIHSDPVPPGGAHILSEELMSVVHDYDWDTSEITSPTKPVARTRLRSTVDTKKQPTKVHLPGNACDGKLNFVVILGPLPKYQSEVDSYFEWHVDGVAYVKNKLMPAHLRAYFRDRHDIKLVWIDTGLHEMPKTLATIFLEESNPSTAMKEFLDSVDGTLLPVSSLVAKIRTRDITGSSMSTEEEDFKNISLLTSIDFMSPGRLPNHPSQELHICRKLVDPSDGKFHIEKLWSISCVPLNLVEETTDDPPWFVSHLCTEDSMEKTSADDLEHSCNVEFSYDNLDPGNTWQAGSRLRLEFESERFCGKAVSQQPESVLILVGAISKHHLYQVLRNGALKSLHTMWGYVQTLNGRMQRLPLFRTLDEEKVYLLKIHKYCTVCGSEPSTDHCSSSKYMLLYPFTRDLALVSYMSFSSGAIMAAIMGQAAQVSTDEGSNNGGQPPNNFGITRTQSTSSQHLESTNKKQIAFHHSLLEDWCVPAVSNKDDWKLPSCTREKEESPLNAAHSEILEELGSYYCTPQHTTTSISSKAKEAPSSKPTQALFTSEEDMLVMLKDEHAKAVEIHLDTAQLDDFDRACVELLSYARNALTTVFRHMQKAEVGDQSVSSRTFVEENLLSSVSDIRKLENGKLQECILQILLRLELASQVEVHEESTISMAEDISSMLRIISLCSSPPIMSHCLSVFVDKYVTTAGELLCEVHNEMMQPLPASLLPYANETSEESFMFPSVANSAASSDLSVGSSGSMCLSNRPRYQRASSISRRNSRQIQVPGVLLKTKQTANNPVQNSDKAEDSIKGRLRSSAKKKVVNDCANGAKKLGSVKRDLFSNAGTINVSQPVGVERPAEQEASVERRSKRLSVSDTPHAKQRMTALCRQRLRLRREKRDAVEAAMPQAIVEESPAKVEESTSVLQPETQRSPRHKIMITRRYSFYCDEKRSRSVTRAKTIQQMQKVAPSTPIANREQKLSTFDPFVSNAETILSPVRARVPMPTASDDSPAKNTRSQATKALFQSPQRRPKGGSSLLRNRPINLFSGEAESIGGIRPFANSPLKEQTCVENQQKGQHLPPVSQEKPSEEETILDVAERTDSSTNAAHPAVRSGTLDGFVIRTQFRKSTSPRTAPRKSHKRKLSSDTTPTRDDINRWPRKKRGVDKSSPGIVTKKRPKKSVSPPPKDPWAMVQFPGADQMNSPDNGLVIFGDGSGTAKSCPLQQPALKTVLSDSNGRQSYANHPLNLTELMKLPISPQLRIGSDGSPVTFRPSFVNTMFQAKESPLQSRTLKEPSAVSLLHIQSSPIVMQDTHRPVMPSHLSTP